LHELVAQLVEQRPFKAWVLGSSPSELTTFNISGWHYLVRAAPLRATLFPYTLPNPIALAGLHRLVVCLFQVRILGGAGPCEAEIGHAVEREIRLRWCGDGEEVGAMHVFKP
jgi:hypothetical protein